MKRRQSLTAERTVAPASWIETFQRARARKLIQDSVCVLASLCLLLGQSLGSRGPGTSHTVTTQDEVVTIGVLPFQDAGGTGAPAKFGQKVAQELQQKLNAISKNLLARPLNAGADASSIAAMSLEQLATLGKQNGVKFVVRGGVLAANIESAGTETKLTVQLYAEVISVEKGAASTVRSEGTGTQAGSSPTSGIQWNSINLEGAEFRNSALGQALSNSLEELATSIQRAILSPATAAQTEAQTGPSGTAPETAATTETATAETDEELLQLIAQAESLISGGSGSVEGLTAINKSLAALKAALASKAALLEQAQDTASADATIASSKEELQVAVSGLMQEVSSNEAAGTEESVVAEPTGEKKGLMSSINGFMDEALSMLQKIQEIRAALRGVDESSVYESGATDQAGGYGNPTEEPTGEGNGVVLDENGNPVQGAEVTDQESGSSTTTDSDGTYNLKGLLSGKLVKLIVTKGQMKMSGQADVFPGHPAVLDFKFKPLSASSKSPGVGVLPSTVILNSPGRLGTTKGILKGVALNAQGRPMPRALVTLKGLGVARTNSQGQYAFLNVPAGAQQLIVNQSGLKTKSAQVQVVAKKSTEARIQFAPSDKMARPATKGSLILRDSTTMLKGTVTDNENRPVAGAKISAVQEQSAVTIHTGLKGTFELRNLRPGPYRVVISKVGYAATSQTVALRPAEAIQRDFQLKKQTSPLIAGLLRKQTPVQRGVSSQARASGSNVSPGKKGQVTGRIVDERSGKPVVDASISISGQSAGKTDLQGNFSLTGLTPGNYQINVKRSGYVSETRVVAIRSGLPTRQDFALKSERREAPEISSAITRPSSTSGVAATRNSQIAGQVSDAKTGKPIAAVIVTLMGQRSVLTDQQGRFAVTNLAAGVYQLTFSKAGFMSSQRTINLPAGRTITANFVLSPAARAPVRLRLP